MTLKTILKISSYLYIPLLKHLHYDWSHLVQDRLQNWAQIKSWMRSTLITVFFVYLMWLNTLTIKCIGPCGYCLSKYKDTNEKFGHDRLHLKINDIEEAFDHMLHAAPRLSEIMWRSCRDRRIMLPVLKKQVTDQCTGYSFFGLSISEYMSYLWSCVCIK